MNISEKIKEMQEDLSKNHALEKNKEEDKLENMIMLMLSDGGYLGPGKIIGESSELLDFMLKEHICGLSIFHKAIDDEESAAENVGMSKALYQ